MTDSSVGSFVPGEGVAESYSTPVICTGCDKSWIDKGAYYAPYFRWSFCPYCGSEVDRRD